MACRLAVAGAVNAAAAAGNMIVQHNTSITVRATRSSTEVCVYVKCDLGFSIENSVLLLTLSDSRCCAEAMCLT